MYTYIPSLLDLPAPLFVILERGAEVPLESVLLPLKKPKKQKNLYPASFLSCLLPGNLFFFTLATIYLFTVLEKVLPFPEGPLFGIIWFAGFSDWLLSLRIMHLSFLHVFSWLDSSFLFITMYRCTTV